MFSVSFFKTRHMQVEKNVYGYCHIQSICRYLLSRQTSEPLKGFAFRKALVSASTSTWRLLDDRLALGFPALTLLWPREMLHADELSPRVACPRMSGRTAGRTAGRTMSQALRRGACWCYLDRTLLSGSVASRPSSLQLFLRPNPQRNVFGSVKWNTCKNLLLWSYALSWKW